MFSNKRLGFISFQQKTTSRQRTKRRWRRRRRRRLSLLFLTVEVAADENKNQLMGHDKEEQWSWSWQKANKDPISSNLFLKRVDLKNAQGTHLLGVRRIGCLIEWRGSGEARLKLEIEEEKKLERKIGLSVILKPSPSDAQLAFLVCSASCGRLFWKGGSLTANGILTYLNWRLSDTELATFPSVRTAQSIFFSSERESRRE